MLNQLVLIRREQMIMVPCAICHWRNGAVNRGLWPQANGFERTMEENPIVIIGIFDTNLKNNTIVADGRVVLYKYY